MKNKRQGGKRQGAGRKPLADKRVAIRFFPLQSRVTLLGEETVKDLCLSTVENAYERGLLAVAKKKKNVR
jgi:hypothetical protein